MDFYSAHIPYFPEKKPMPSITQLGLFTALVFGIMALPGMDMAYILSQTLVGGRTRGLTALAGIVVGGLCHTVAAYAGLALLIATQPDLLRALLWAGCGYLAWIGWQLWQVDAAPGTPTPTMAGPRGNAQVFGQAVLTCLLNPKAYLFMFSVFPQFLQPDPSTLGLQCLLLGSIIAAIQVLVYGMVIGAASHAHTRLRHHDHAWVWAHRGMGVLLMAGAVLTVGLGG